MKMVLSSAQARPRRNFDPTRIEDLRELAFFRKNKKWQGGCPFTLEWPYDNIVDMCIMKYADKMLAEIA